MCTKYEVNRGTYVEVISIFVGGMFLGVTLYVFRPDAKRVLRKQAQTRLRTYVLHEMLL